MDQPLTIRLIRHEKTKSNVERKYLGWTDESILNKLPLEPLSWAPERVYGSDLVRCQQTARKYFTSSLYIGLTGLRELNFGQFELKSYEQLQQLPVYRQWIDNPYEVTPPCGEAFNDFKQRVLHTIFEVVRSGGQYVFVVHGGVIRLLLSMYDGTGRTFRDVEALHHTIYTLQWEKAADFIGGASCTLLLEEPLTASELT
jgi:alpha-ribazole phosphatase